MRSCILRFIFIFVFSIALVSIGRVDSARAAISCPEIFRKIFSGLKKSELKDPDLNIVGAVPATPSEFRDFTFTPRALDELTSTQKFRRLATNRVWIKYATDFQNEVRANILKSSATYVNAIRTGHPHIAFLKRLGYQFEISADGVLDVKVPPLEGALKEYEKLMRAHVATGRIRADQVLMPVRAFDLNGELVFIKFGDDIPLGAKPHANLLTNEEFTRAHRLKVFVLGEPAGSNLASPLHSALEHDLGHLSAYEAFPEYQATMSDFFASLEGAPKKYVQRGFYLHETMEGVGQKNRPQLIEIFRRYGVETGSMKEGRPSTKLEFKRKIQKLSDHEVHELLAEIESKRHVLIEKVGGAQRDIMDRQFNVNLVAGTSMPGYTEAWNDHLRQYSFLMGPDGLIDLVKYRPSERRRLLVELLTALDNTSLINFDDVVNEAARAKIDRNSGLYYLFCVNKIISPPRGFCK